MWWQEPAHSGMLKVQLSWCQICWCLCLGGRWSHCHCVGVAAWDRCRGTTVGEDGWEMAVETSEALNVSVGEVHSEAQESCSVELTLTSCDMISCAWLSGFDLGHVSVKHVQEPGRVLAHTGSFQLVLKPHWLSTLLLPSKLSLLQRMEFRQFLTNISVTSHPGSSIIKPCCHKQSFATSRALFSLIQLPITSSCCSI